METKGCKHTFKINHNLLTAELFFNKINVMKVDVFDFVQNLCLNRCFFTEFSLRKSVFLKINYKALFNYQVYDLCLYTSLYTACTAQFKVSMGLQFSCAHSLPTIAQRSSSLQLPKYVIAVGTSL